MSLSSTNAVQKPTINVKVVFVGESGVGKTSLIGRECDNSFPSQQQYLTIGLAFLIKTYDFGLIKIKAQLWDTAGQERFRSVQKSYYRNAKAVCLCFSLAHRRSFEVLDRWIKQLNNYQVPRDNMILIGCKSDLDVQVATDQILVFAQKQGIQYFQTSSLTGEGVSDAFKSMMVSCAQKQVQICKKEQKKQVSEQNAILTKSKTMGIKKQCC